MVIDHSPASSGRFIGSPSLVVLANGEYLASHDFFGPKSDEFAAPVTMIFRSCDRGMTWTNVASISGAFWSSLFTHRGEAYLLGTDRHHGRIVIRRSVDQGQTWPFLIPILGGDSPDKSANIWCAKDSTRVWREWMLEGKAPPRNMASCETPMARNLALSRKYKINATPAIIFEDGTRNPGTMSAQDLERRLASSVATR